MYNSAPFDKSIECSHHHAQYRAFRHPKCSDPQPQAALYLFSSPMVLSSPEDHESDSVDSLSRAFSTCQAAFAGISGASLFVAE